MASTSLQHRLLRRPIGQMSYKNRCFGLCTREVLFINSIRRRLIHYAVLLYHLREDPVRNSDVIDLVEHLYRRLYAKLVDVQYLDEPPPHVRTRPVSRTIDSFAEDECWQRFRTLKVDLPRLLHCLKLDQQDSPFLIMSNGCRFTYEEILLFSLNRLVYPGRLQDLARDTYGRDYTQWSRAFHWFINYVCHNFGYLLTNNLNYWVDYFPTFCRAIQAKLIEKGGPEYVNFRVAGFIDCTVIQSCRAGGGPIGSGPLAPRWDEMIQRSVYNGWKKHHGTKFQTVEGPNGMCLHMYGPSSFRQSDLELYAASDIDRLWGEAQQGRQTHYVMYGDGIYLVTNNCHSNADNVMTKARIANEWAYGVTSNLFQLCKHKMVNKLLLHRNISRYYFVATLLRNAHMCLYDGQSANYYECSAPSLENYFAGRLDNSVA